MALPLLNVRFILLISASFVAIFSSIAIYFCLPILISHILRTQLTLSISSGSFNDWKVNSVIDRIYLYNITNLNDIMPSNGGDLAISIEKNAPTQQRQVIKLKQIGPITFRQDRDKLNILFDTINETVIYDQRKSWTFLPELSLFKSLDELNTNWIEHINVPLAGTTMNPEYAEFIDPIILEHDLRLFLNHSVNTLLFEGYYDILMEQAKATGQIDVDKFGWMHNQNNSITKAIRIFTGTSNATLNRFGSIDEYQYKKRMSIWHNNASQSKDLTDAKCNEFRYSSAGEFFPPSEYSIINYNNGYRPNDQINRIISKDTSISAEYKVPYRKSSEKLDLSSSTSMDRHLSLIESNQLSNGDQVSDKQKLKKHDQKLNQTISLFMPDLCRTIQLYYNGSYHYRDLLVDRYIANEFTFDYTSDIYNESNKCFCIYNETSRTVSCPPNGIMELFACRKGSPVAISFPHFLYSNKDKSLEQYLKLFEYIDDGEPNLGEHQFFIDLESTLNVPVNVQIVLQFNVRIRNDPMLNFTREYAFLFEDPIAQKQSKDIYLPQMWIKSTAEASEKDLNNLRFIQEHLDLVTPITSITIFGIASILLFISAKLAYDLTYGPKSRKSISCDQELSSPLNGTFDCSYQDAKQKYFVLQSKDKDKKSQLSPSNLLDANSSENGNIKYKSCNYNKKIGLIDQPSTSKVS